MLVVPLALLELVEPLETVAVLVSLVPLVSE